MIIFYPKKSQLLNTFLLLLWSVFTLNSHTLQAQALSGNYTINANQPAAGTNFQNFTALASALSQNGMSGPVTVTVTPASGPYTEQVIFSNISGLGATNTLLIEGSGETITALTDATNRHIIRLTNLNFVTINNLKVARNVAAASGFFGIHIYQSGSNITISNCEADMTGSNSTLVGGFIASGSETSILAAGNFQNISFTGNTTNGGGYGVSLFGQTSPLSQGIIISNNTINDFASNGIYLRETDGVQVFGNHFDRTLTASGANAIQLAQAANINAHIHANFIRIASNSISSGTYRGIYLFNGTGHKVYNNVISDINLTTGNFTAIEIRTGSTFSEISYNTISIDHSAPAAGNYYGIKEELSNTGAILRNNIISISQPTTGAAAALFLASTSNIASAVNSNHNLIYVPTGNVALRGTTPYTALASWQSASTQDANSLAVNPMFLLPSLPRPTNVAADNAGTPVTGITVDVLGQTRGTPPDVGAYEFQGCTPPAAPAAISGQDSICAFASGINFSVVPVTGITTYEWSVPTGASIISGQGTTAIVVNFGNTSGNISVSSDSSGCMSIPVQLAVFVAAPIVVNFDLAQPTVCVFAAPIPLNTGSPAGGVYSGPGVNMNTFSPNVAGLGQHTLVYTVVNALGCSYSDSTIITVAGCVNVETEASLNQKIRLYPNPFEQQTTLDLSAIPTNQFTITIYDEIGRIQRQFLTEKGMVVIEKDQLSSGVYLISISTAEGQQFFRKMIIK